jgi:hypothetical protein
MWSLLLACRPPGGELRVRAPDDQADVFADYVAFLDDDRVTVGDDVARANVVLSLDRPGPAGSYALDQGRGRVTVHAGDALGLQYGLTAVLEAAGYGFFHPSATHRPEALPDDVGGLALDAGPVAPETARRGLHLHTLHPIEAYYDFWEPGEEQAERARRTLDWIVKSRGNFVQYPALDDVVRYELLAPEWQAHTADLVAYAHARGLTYGLGVQLFGSGNLQNAFDLVDGDTLDDAEIRARLQLLAPLGLDTLSLSFGEFSGEEPERFVETGNHAVALVGEELPTVSDVVTTIHVGNYDDLRIEYQGEELLYYFLADEIDGATPWIHTVMYYNLYEDAGGAYLHDEFDEHRTFLEEHLAAGEPVGYHPESAYWVAFDDSIPTYLPVYLRSRFTDLDRLRAAGLSLQDHVTFTSGWEWGYWQTDAAILRWNHTLPATWEETVAATWAPFGPDGAVASDAIVGLADLQHEHLIVRRLAPWMAGRDAIIDFGDASLGILSQPDRPLPAEIVALPAAELAALDGVVAGLAELADGTEALGAPLAGVRDGDPFFDELRDGFAVDVARARFASHVLAASLAVARGQDPAPALAAADAELAVGEGVVARRRAATHWAGGDRILQPVDENATIYRYGYLGRADELCFWRRERAQAAVAAGESVSVPPCT